jgi:hypothetical protein
LLGSDLELFQANILTLVVRGIAEHNDRIAIAARPLAINAVEASILSDPVEHVVRRNRQDTGPDLFEREFDRSGFRHSRPPSSYPLDAA